LKRVLRIWARWLPAVLLCLGGCQTLVSETLDLEAEVGSDGACRYQAGAYALPTDLIRLEIRKVVGKDQDSYELQQIDTIRTADPGRIYCLDFLGSALSNDKVAIQRGTDSRTDADGSSLLLSKISSDFSDQSLVIANALVDAAARIVTTPRGGFGQPGADKVEVVVAQFDVDPFDFKQITKVNAALEELHYCIFLDPTNDAHVPGWHSGLCTDRGAAPSKDPLPYHGLSIVKPESPPPSDALRGILYRPLLTHKLVVMRRNFGPTGPAWQIFETKRLQMANAAPAFLLEVNRSMFVQRKMDIVFSGGVLTSVEIDKPSEAEQLSGFVLRTVQVAVSIPIRALILGRSAAKNREDVIKAQAQLIETLEKYQAAVNAAAAQRDKLKDVRPTRFAGPRFGASETGLETDLLSDCVRALQSTSPDPTGDCEAMLASGGSFEQ
jgi:hypothetical protein